MILCRCEGTDYYTVPLKIKGVDFMKNKFMLELTYRLLPLVSFDEMKEILDDYSGFMVDSQVNEKPKEVMKSLEIPKKNGFIAGVLFVAFWLFFVYFNMWSMTAYNFPFYTLAAITIIFGGVGLFLIYSQLSKKLMFISKFSSNRKSSKTVNAIFSVIVIIGMLSFIGWIISSFIYTYEYENLANVGLFIESLYTVFSVFPIVALVLFFIKGSDYFFSFCSSLASVTAFTAIKLFLSSISSMEWYIFPYLYAILGIYILEIVIIAVLYKKLKKVTE